VTGFNLNVNNKVTITDGINTNNIGSNYITTTTGPLIINSDVSFNANLYVAGNTVLNGIMNIEKTSFVTNISEKIISVTGSSNIYTLNYQSGSIFYLSNAPTANISLNMRNVPSITDSNHSYVLSIIYNGTSANYYANSVNISINSNTGTTYTPQFANTPNINNIGSNQLIIQQIIYVYLGSNGYILSNVNGYGS